MESFKAYAIAMELAAIATFLRTAPKDPVSGVPCEFYGDGRLHIAKTDGQINAYVLIESPYRRELVFSFNTNLWEVMAIRPGFWMVYAKQLVKDAKRALKEKNKLEVAENPFDDDKIFEVN